LVPSSVAPIRTSTRAALFIEPDIEVDTVGPPVDVTLLAQIALTPFLVISFPSSFEPHDVGGRQTGSFLAQDRGQSFSKISSRDSLQIQHRNQCVDAGRAAHKGGQNRAGKPSSITMSYPRLTNFNGPNSADYLPLWQMSVTHNQPLSILITPVLVELNERPLPRFRLPPAIASALLPEAIVRKTTSLYLQLAYRARSLYSLALAHPFFSGVLG
jgi:hypothetical protein